MEYFKDLLRLFGYVVFDTAAGKVVAHSGANVPIEGTAIADIGGRDQTIGYCLLVTQMLLDPFLPLLFEACYAF